MNYSSIFVSFTQPGFHFWPNPTEGRQYLGHTHRHLFHVKVSMNVTHDDREVEFHDLLDFARLHFPGGDLGGQSCEMLARKLATKVVKQYNRPAEISVSEDGEVGAVVILSPSDIS